MTSIAQAYVEILPSARGMGRALQGEMGGVQSTLSSGTRQGFLGGFANIAAPLAAIVGGLGLGSMISDSISAASDLSETRSAVQQVFGDSSGAIESFASTAATELGQTQQQALDAARTFGIFGQAAGLSGGDLSSFSTDLVGLATDFASFNNVEPDVAIQAIGAGLRGEAEPLRQFGILLDDAALRSRAMEMGIYDGNGALTQQQRVMAAQAEIFAQAGVQAGDFERTQGGLANQQRILQASIGELSASFGSMLLPIVTEIVGFLNSSVLPALSAFTTWAQENPALLGTIVAVIGTFAAVLGVLAIAQWAANSAMLANPVTWIIVGIAALVAAIIALAMNWDTVVAWITGVWGGFVAWLRGIGDGIAAWWNGLWAGISAWLTTTWNTIVTAVTMYVTMMQAVITAVVGAISAWWNSIWSGIGAFFQGIWNGIVAFVTAYINTVRAVIMAALSFIQSVWNNAWSAVGRVLSDAWNNIVNGVQTGIGNVVSFVQGLPGRVMSAIGNIGSLLLNSGRSLIQGFIDGIRSMIGAVGDAVGGVMDFVAGFFPNSPAKRGPLSGSGWRDILRSGGAIEAAFSSGFTGSIDDVIQSRVPVPRGGSMLASVAASDGGDRPIYTDTGTLLGWIRQQADGVARLVWAEMDSADGFNYRLGVV